MTGPAGSTLGTRAAGMRVGIVAKSHLRAATTHLVDIADWLGARGVQAVFETGTAHLMPPSAGHTFSGKFPFASAGHIVHSLGGSGTVHSNSNYTGHARSGISVLY